MSKSDQVILLRLTVEQINQVLAAVDSQVRSGGLAAANECVPLVTAILAQARKQTSQGIEAHSAPTKEEAV